jgi:glycosyltransferase involved in cell wall biosynthesis
MEKNAVHQAARVICNTGRLAEDFRSCYPNLPPEHFIPITNGYDPDDFEQLPSPSRDNQNSDMVIAYAGSLYGARNPQPLFQALGALLQRKEASAAACRLRFIGTKLDEQIRQQAREFGVEEQVEILPPVPRSECLQQLGQAQVLLLIQPEAPLQVPAKVFEYLQIRRPILTLAGKGATQEMIDRTGAGIVVDPEDVEGLSQALLQLLKKHQEGTLLEDQAERDFSALHFRNLTGQLAGVLDEVSHS